LSSKLNTVSCSNCFTSHDYLDFDGWGYCAWQDMVPPKDPYIKVRVLDDMGEGILLSDKTANLARHSMHFLKRTDAEQYIARVGCHGDLVSWNFLTFDELEFHFFPCLINRAWWKSLQADIDAGVSQTISMTMEFQMWTWTCSLNCHSSMHRYGTC